MELMLNKLKSTVTKVTADVTSAVMGNPVTREFDVGRHIASGGNKLAWKIFNGFKKSTKQEVAVFVFDKKLMDKYQKFEKDQIIDCLKRGVQQLTRLRHPRLLTVQHPLEESRDCLAFCTEPVSASLANILGNWENLPSPLPSNIKEYNLYDVETKYGLLQVSEGLSFLHSSVKMIHGNLTPENIILNKSGAWKIMGFDFCIQSINPSEQELSRLNSSNLQNIPEDVREHVKLLLNVTPAVRPDADQMTKIPFFSDVGAMTLQYFDSLFQRDNLQKSQFFKGLPKVLPKLPKRVIVQRILPCLTSEFVNPDMVPFVLPNVLLIAEECTKEEYIKLILPDLSPVFRQHEPIQASNMILLIFLQKMDLLLTKTPPDEIKNSVLPMVYRALEAPSIQIQELCLNIIPTFANLIDYPSMKNSLIPRIKNACLQTSSLAVRVNSLVCLGKILEYLDKWFVLDDILPFLQQIPSKEPAVLMGILGIYKCTFSHKKLGITKEQLAGKVLPHLIPLSIENNLNLNQFNSFISVIKEMLGKLEAEHKTKLEQIHVMQEQQKYLGAMELALAPLPPPVLNMTKDLTDTLRDNIASLTTQPISKPKLPSSSSFSSVGIGMGFSSSVENTKRNGLNANMGFQPSGFGMGIGTTSQNFFGNTGVSGMANMNMLPTANMPSYSPLNTTSPVVQQSRTSDMSALDSLFGTQKPKVSMNQLSQQKTNQWLNQFAPPQATTNSCPLGTQMNVMGQTGFGLQGNPFFNPQNFTQPTNSMINSSSASKDLNDLFG
ncbi:hypothetical protein Chor_010108 [Crotalus horridus]